jgi:hypothetical protein
MKKLLGIAVVILICAPLFFRMLRPGIYSMQDFHFFRLVEFHKCIADGQIPCRWSPDAGLGYGEPMFNFYAQGIYLIGEVYHLIGMSFIDALKFSFIVTFLGSALIMYFLAKNIWKSTAAALVSSILYVYAPYRAVDVWVRGALPEAGSFVLFPLIFLCVEKYIENSTRKRLVYLSLSVGALLLIHNLSVLIFMPILLVWIAYRIFSTKNWRAAGGIFFGLLLSALIAAFYVLPVIFESKYVSIASTTLGYFDFRGHFTTSMQLLFSMYWGYGASIFGTGDGLNLSVGYLQWILPLVAVATVVLQKKFKKCGHVLVLFSLGALALFLTHERSALLWVTLQDVMKYIQFPWRFLGIAVFFLSLCAGALPLLIKKYQWILVGGVFLISLLVYGDFFKEDIWYKVTDSDLLTTKALIEQSRGSIGDYWPNFGHIIPNDPAPLDPVHGYLSAKTSNTVYYNFNIPSAYTNPIEVPINYFPGWLAFVNQNPVTVQPSTHGLIQLQLPQGFSQVTLMFTDTSIRTVGNVISMVSILFILILYAI